MSEKLGLAATWEKLQAMKDTKPAYTIAQANVKGYCDFIAGNGFWYRVSSQGHDKFTIRRI